MVLKQPIEDILRPRSIISTHNAEGLQLLLSYQIKGILKSKSIDPSYIVSKAKISFNEPVERWDQLKLYGKHYLEVSNITILVDHGGKDINMELIDAFFSDSEYFLPIIRSVDIEDWPLLLSAQIQNICEFKEISPCQLLTLFSIYYDGHLEDEWNNFNWKDSLIPVFLMVTISNKGAVYDN